MYECFHCGCRTVIWDCDYNSGDFGYEEGGLVHVLHCENCGAQIEYLLMPPDEGEDR